MSRPSLHIRTPTLFQVELEKNGCEQVDMLWCQSAQNIGLSNHKLKSVLSASPSQRDRRTNIVAIAQRFVLHMHHALKSVTFNVIVFYTFFQLNVWNICCRDSVVKRNHQHCEQLQPVSTYLTMTKVFLTVYLHIHQPPAAERWLIIYSVISVCVSVSVSACLLVTKLALMALYCKFITNIFSFFSFFYILS